MITDEEAEASRYTSGKTDELGMEIFNAFVDGARRYRDEMRKRWPSEHDCFAKWEQILNVSAIDPVEGLYHWLRSRILGDTDTKGGDDE
jgi:hypothetical protein